MIVARNISALIAARGTNAAELAKVSGLNPTGIYDIISGKSQSPKISTLAKIAKALHVPISAIFEEATDSQLRSDILAALEHLSEPQRDLLLKTAKAWGDEAA